MDNTTIEKRHAGRPRGTTLGKIRLTVHLPPALVEFAKARAAEESITISAYIEALLRREARHD